MNFLKVQAKFFVVYIFFRKRIDNRIFVPILEVKKQRLREIKKLTLSN